MYRSACRNGTAATNMTDIEPKRSSIAGLSVACGTPRKPNPDRPPVLLVHGAWHGAWCWEDHFLPFFAGEGFATYAVDLRGHGQSPAKKSMRFNRIRDYVDDVLSVVESFENPPVVIGHSMGGLVCQHLLQRTSHLAAVGLLATVPIYGVWKATVDIATRRPLDFAKTNLMLSLWPLVQDPQKAKHMFLDEDTGDTETLDFHAKLADESWLGFIDMLLLDLPKKENRALPMLVVGGEKDTIFPPDAQRHTAKFYACDCHIVPDAPHDLMLSKHWQVAAGHFAGWLEQY